MTGPEGRRARSELAAASVALLAIALVALVAQTGLLDGGPAPEPTSTSRPTTGTPAIPSPSASTSAGPSPSPSPAPSPSPSTSAVPAPGDPSGVALELEPLVDGLDRPVYVTGPGGAGDRLFVLEQVGRIRVVRDGELLDRPFLDLTDRVSTGGERGLLGLAFHPRFPDDPRLFVDYTDRAGDTVVSSFRVDPGDPDRADPGSESVLLTIDQPYANHNGGAVVFGPDGLLYIATGDGGSAGDPHDNGQRLDTLLGKLLRIDVDRPTGRLPYGIPSTNPFVDRPAARPEIWAYGLRNPWRISFDRQTGDLWIADVGQSRWEEIDVARAGEGAGANYGWRIMEGAHCFGARGCSREGLVLPVAEYSHDEGCSVTGGYVYRGSRSPALAGVYLYADYCSGFLWGLSSAGAGAGAEPVRLLETGLTPSSFGEDGSGEVYLVDHAGWIVRIVGRPR